MLIAGNARGLRRHLAGALATIRLLRAERPRVVWYQYSVALGAVIALYVRLAHATALADVHTKALYRRLDGPAGALLHWVKRWSLRACRAVLVANDQNAAYARERLCLDPVVLPDPPPVPVPGGIVAGESPSDVVFICSFAPDEPVGFIAEVAGRVRSELSVAVTGDPEQLSAGARESLSLVARLTGFLPDADYWALLRHARCIVVLTTESGCVPCGAYEAMALGRRPVVFDDAAVRSVFGDDAVYIAPHADEALTAIEGELRRDPVDSWSHRPYQGRWGGRWAEVSRRLESHGLMEEAR